MSMKQIPIDLLHRMLRYDEDTGKLYWKTRTADMFGGSRPEHTCKIWNSRFAGKEAFTAIDSHGYHYGCINNSPFKAHRVVWALCYGVWSELGIDHRDHDKTNNRIGNLLPATQRDNMQNRLNNSKTEGVSWHQGMQQFKIVYNGELIGFADSLRDGQIAYNRLIAKPRRKKLAQHRT